MNKRQREAFDALFLLATDTGNDLVDDDDAAQRREGRKLLNRVVIAKAFINRLSDHPKELKP